MLPAGLHPNGTMHALAGIDSLQNPNTPRRGCLFNTIVCFFAILSRLTCLVPELLTSSTDPNAAFASIKQQHSTDQKVLSSKPTNQPTNDGKPHLNPGFFLSVIDASALSRAKKADFALSQALQKQACPANSWALTLVVALRGKRTITTSTTTRLCSKT
jgi:hypothetical protein